MTKRLRCAGPRASWIADRYLAALLAPASARDALLALAAFHGEIARIPVGASEPTIAAMRLQWWRDVLLDAPSGEATGSPVADSLRRALAGNAAATREAVSIIEAYEELLYPAALSAPGAVEAFTAASQGSAFRLAVRMLGGTRGGRRWLAAGADHRRRRLLRPRATAAHPAHFACCASCPFCCTRGLTPSRRPHRRLGPRYRPRCWPRPRAGLAEVRRDAPLAAAPHRQAILPAALVGPI
ncbi:MAG: squalene/phytoene synthase family protein [Hyphomicrobium sp.]